MQTAGVWSRAEVSDDECSGGEWRQNVVLRLRRRDGFYCVLDLQPRPVDLRKDSGDIGNIGDVAVAGERARKGLRAVT
jgi:hypothetical protein